MIEEKEEIWKDIPGYEGLYQVSNTGKVKSLNYMKTRKEKIMKPDKHSSGYFKVILSKDGEKKSYFIHRLVASSFVQNESLFYNEINHIDECKTNNCASNLEWCDHIYNMNFGTRVERITKAKSKTVICIETGKIYPSTRYIERKFGFYNSYISKCCRGKIESAYGYHWQYV